MSPNAGGGGWGCGSQPMSTAVHRSPYTHINLGDLSPYLSYKATVLPSVPIKGYEMLYLYSRLLG
jgi:hypothetical protein